MEDNPILYVVLNKELNMSAGKAAAQAVHAAMMLGSRGAKFAENTRRSVIVLEAENAEQIKNLDEYLSGTPLYSDYYIDEGVNEVGAYSVTALACEPIDASDERFREIFKPFKLFSGADNYEEQAYTALKRVRWAHRNGMSEGVPWYLRLTIRWLKKNK
jgi:peptidyl-tRNA hydrolase